ncbi:helix-turn-helix domain-containing protein [Thermodesulfobacteriota bacterium]
MPNPKEKKKLLGTRDVAMILDMSPDTVADFARKDILRGKKVGRQWKFRQRDVILLNKKLSSM